MTGGYPSVSLFRKDLPVNSPPQAYDMTSVGLSVRWVGTRREVFWAVVVQYWVIYEHTSLPPKVAELVWDFRDFDPAMSFFETAEGYMNAEEDWYANLSIEADF